MSRAPAKSKRQTARKPAGKAKVASKTRTSAKSAAKRAAKRAVLSKVKGKPAKGVRAAKAVVAAKQSKPIDLYYWTTPNGLKISIMLEECRLPYTVRPVNISQGEQFAPEFLAISPNNRIPAIVDPQGPGGRPVSVFESGAILQYLGRKTGKFYPADERGRVDVEQWLMWQMGGLGPMAGQAHHFRQYAPEQIPYAIKRYTDECHRLYGVMNKRLADRDFLAGKYSIADMACVGWANRYERQGQDLGDFPHLKRWLDSILARPAVKTAMAITIDAARQVDMRDPKVQAVLFNQRAR
jgi:GSH-dependent disulfide-bond oxidoreductase